MWAKLKRKTCNKRVKINTDSANKTKACNGRVKKKNKKGKNLMPAFKSLIQAKQTCPPLLNTSDETTPNKQEQPNINCGIALVWELRFVNVNFLRSELSITNVNFMRAELSIVNVNFMGAEHWECEFYESEALQM